MVTPAEKRISRYTSKVDADVVRARISALKDSMVESATVKQAEIATIQGDVKAYLNSVGVIPELNVAFIKVAMKLYGLSQKHSGVALEREAKSYLTSIYLKYKEGGISETVAKNVLEWIASYFGITWTVPP